MKKLVVIIFLFCLHSIVYAGSSANAVITKMRAMHTGGRNYYSLGGISMRFDNNVVYPVKITPPSISAGCNGIDATLGGVSFMDEEHLGDLWDQMTDNNQWVAIGTGIAVKMLSNELGTQIENLQDLISKLNNMQFDACAAMTAVASYPVDSDQLKNMYNRAKKAMSDIRDDASSLFESVNKEDETKGDRAETIKKEIPKLSSKQYIIDGGSLLEYLFKTWLKGSSSGSGGANVQFPSEVKVEELRALYGDIQLVIEEVEEDKVKKTVEVYNQIAPCDAGLYDYEQAFYKREYKAGEIKECEKTDAPSFEIVVKAALADYANFVVNMDKKSIDNQSKTIDVLDVLAAYNISQLIADSAGIGDQAYFLGVVEDVKDISITLITYNYTDMFYEKLIILLYRMKNEVDANGKELGTAFSSALEKYIEQIKIKHLSYEKSREGSYNIYAGSLAAKRQEIEKKLLTSPIKRIFTAEK
jgi:conjugative transfer pilus assembly protein TraH